MLSLTVFVIDDEESQRNILKDFLTDLGCEAKTFAEGAECISTLEEEYADVVITDYKMPGMNGIEALQQIKDINPEIQVIVITAYGTIENAVKAMKNGAWDYITKPIEMEELEIKLDRIQEHNTLLAENKRLKNEIDSLSLDTDIIYRSPEMEEIINLIGRISKRESSVLIQGETGTGKELVAKTIHNLSNRKEKHFVPVNCAAIPENLFESELFGYEKGAFTGADQRKKGRFELAKGGTLFLDEVGEIPENFQVKLLRVIQEREFQRLGGSKTIDADIRLLAATNRKLKHLVDEGKFRSDLYFRLNVIPINIPPLRERKDDIPVLAEHFIEKYTRKNDRDIEGISSEALDILMKYDFPGNVRELENIIERAVSLSRDTMITPDSLLIGTQYQNQDKNLKEKVASYEKSLIKKALEENNNVQTDAAEDLGVSVTTLNYKIKKYFKEEDDSN